MQPPRLPGSRRARQRVNFKHPRGVPKGSRRSQRSEDLRWTCAVLMHPGGVPEYLHIQNNLASLRDAPFFQRPFRRSSLRGDLRWTSAILMHPGGVPESRRLPIGLASLRDARSRFPAFRRSPLRGDLRLPSGKPPACRLPHPVRSPKP